MEAQWREFKGDLYLDRPLIVGTSPLTFLEDSRVAIKDTRIAYTDEGKKAKVYKARWVGSEVVALKVFKKRFAVDVNEVTSKQLEPWKATPGLRVCGRSTISVQQAALLHEPGLAYAVIMPWIHGQPWTVLIDNKKLLSKQQCLELAQKTVDVLANLERMKLAHADISGSNVYIQFGDLPDVQLIDVEDMYHPTFIDVPSPPDGTPGYAHPRNRGSGCCNPSGDRFAAAILLAEMLVWHSFSVRHLSASDSYFLQNEICTRNQKFKILRNNLQGHSERLADLFDAAWGSSALSQCPSLTEWQSAISQVSRPERQSSTLAGLRPLSLDRIEKKTRPQEQLLAGLSPCAECGKIVRDGTPFDHAEKCTHHPNQFGERLAEILPNLEQSPRGALEPEPAFQSLLTRYGMQTCPNCGAFVGANTASSLHKVGCPNRHTPTPPSADSEAAPTTGQGKPEFEGVSFIPFNSASLDKQSKASSTTQFVCPQCAQVVTVEGNDERGHKFRCARRRSMKRLDGQ